MNKVFNRELVVIIAVLGMGVLSRGVLEPILPLYLTSIGVVPTILGLMFSVAQIGMIIGGSFSGWMADKVGLKFPMSIGTFVSALLMFCFVLTREYPVIFLIFLSWGITRAALLPVGRGYVGTTVPVMRKATFMAILAAVLAGARGLGTLMGGFVADAWGYSRTFYISSSMALLGGFIVVVGLMKIRLVKPKSPAVSPLTAELSSPEPVYNYRSLAFQGIITALQFLGLGVTIAFLPLLATQVVGVDVTEVGVLFTIQEVVTMLLLLPMGILADRRGKRVLMILGLLASAFGLAGVAFAGSFLWLIVFVSIRSLGVAMFKPAAAALLSNTVPLHRQSTVMGFYSACELIGVLIGSALGGFIWSAWGPSATFLLATTAAGLGAVISFFGLLRERVSEGRSY